MEYEKRKKRDFNFLTAAILGFVVVAVLTVIAFKIVGTMKANETASSYAANGAGKVESALTDMTGYYSIIAIIVILVVILGFLGVRNLLQQ